MNAFAGAVINSRVHALSVIQFSLPPLLMLLS